VARQGRPGGSAGRGGGTSRGSGDRTLTQRVKTARGRKLSSQKWIERQLNDTYVHKAKAAGFRSRAAFKLIEIDDRFHILKRGMTVVDLGAAPGGWTQVAVDRIGATARAPVVAIDLLPMDPVAGATVLTGDFTADDAPARLIAALGGRRPNVVLSDLAPDTTGHRATDHLRIVALVELAMAFARETLAPGGTFLAKVFQGGTEGEILTELRRDYVSVRHVKPPASRPESPETYVLATGFRGGAAPAGEA
jgi:23S rRNA (uridine2552-2'-O)-methyltransferase